MSDWKLIQIIELDGNWKAIDTSAELIRISHNLSDFESDTRFLKAAIAKGNRQSGQVVTYQPQLVSYREEPEIFLLTSPIISLNKIAVRRLDSRGGNWRVKIERYSGNLNQNTLTVDAIVERLVPLFTSLSSTVISKNNLVPNNYEINVTDGTAGLLIAANANRRFLTINNENNNKSITLGFTVDVNGVMQEEWVTIPKKGYFEIPIAGDGSLYTGDIYGLPDFTGTIKLIEFTQGDVL